MGPATAAPSPAGLSPPKKKNNPGFGGRGSGAWQGGFVAGIWEEGAGRDTEQGGSVVTVLPLVQSAPLFLGGESLAVAHQEKPEKWPAREHGHSPAWMRPRGESSSWETGLGVKGGGPQGDAPGVWALTRLESSGSGPRCCSAASSLPAIGRGEERRRKEGRGRKIQPSPGNASQIQAGGHLQPPGGTVPCPAAGTGAAPGTSAWPQVMHQPREVPRVLRVPRG